MLRACVSVARSSTAASVCGALIGGRAARVVGDCYQGRLFGFPASRGGPLRMLLRPSATAAAMTLIWFIIWLISVLVGSREPLLFNPVNVWTATLLAAVALDLAAVHASSGSRR
jgi:hypothetical protein